MAAFDASDARDEPPRLGLFEEPPVPAEGDELWVTLQEDVVSLEQRSAARARCVRLHVHGVDPADEDHRLQAADSTPHEVEVTASDAPQIVTQVEGALERVHVCVEDGGPHSDDPSPPKAQIIAPANLTAGPLPFPSTCHSGRRAPQRSLIDRPAPTRN